MRSVFSVVAMIILSGLIGACAASNGMLGAINMNNLQSVQGEIDKGANLNELVRGRTYLMWASGPFVCRPNMIQLMIERGADPKIVGENGETALATAAAKCSPDTLEILLKKGAAADQPNDSGTTPLMFAAGSQFPANATLLLNHGARINAQNKSGFSPLLFAAAQGTPESVKMLLDRGADANVMTSDGLTLLMCAAGNKSLKPDNRLELLQTVLALKPDVNRSNKDGLTPLLIAIRNGNVEGALLLMNHGADIKVADRTGRTALIDAVNVGQGVPSQPGEDAHPPETLTIRGKIERNVKDRQAHLETLIMTLLEKGVDVNAQTTDSGASALMIAVSRGETNVVKMLLNAKADLNLKDKRGMSALDMSKSKKPSFVKQEDKVIRHLLEENGAK